MFETLVALSWRQHGAFSTGQAEAEGVSRTTLGRHSSKGTNGIATFRRALRALSSEVPDSEFERLVIRDLVAAGVPEPRLHHLVTLDATGPTELDLDWPGRLLDVEPDGRDHIARMATAKRDRARDRALQRAGYFVARFVWADYLEDRAAMISEIADLVDSRATKSACGVTPA